MSTAEESRKRTDAVLIELRKIIQSIDLHSKHLVRVCGLTGPQLLILRTIYESGPTTASTLARTISLSQATVTGILDRLEKRGLLARSRSDTDRRKVIVQATPDGERLLEKAPPPLQESFVTKFSRIANWEQTMILSALQRVVSMMDANTLDAAPMLTTGPIDTVTEDSATTTSESPPAGTK